MNQGEIVIYKASDNADFQIEVRVEDETVWLTQVQMSELFQTTRNNITLHISNIFKERELEKFSVCKEYLLSHDRFLIIDHQKIFHIGASLKDLGKKWFAFSKIELDAKDMIEKLK